jgi:serine/threonine protein kinase
VHALVDQKNTKDSWSSLPVGAIGRGARFDQYEIIDTLQKGGMGEVVLAEAIDTQGKKSRVVLKRLLADLLEDEKYVRMFLLEAQVMSRLDHPNIVKFYDVPQIDGKQCLAMEYVLGVNVHHVLKRCRKLNTQIPPQLAVHIMAEVLQGLHYAHTFVLDDGCPLELVHRDVTPGNLLLSFDGEVKVTDFGISKSKMSQLSTTVGVVKGTTRYLSPEQIRGDQATARSDLFSSATVLVEMLTGAPLFDRGTVPPTLFAIASGQRERIEKLLPVPAPRLAAVLEKALALDPRQRHASARVFRDELIAAASVELGRLIDRHVLASFLRELFPEKREELAAAEGEDANAAGLDNLDLTYLFEVHDPVSLAPGVAEVEQVREAMKQMVTGAEPLDAAEFSEKKVAPVVEKEAVADITKPQKVVFAAPKRSRAWAWMFVLGAACGAIAMKLLDREPANEAGAAPRVAQIAPVVIELEKGGAMLDIRRPRGARLTLDGVAIERRVPVVGLRIAPGEHTLTVVKGSWKRTYVFEAEDGDRFDLADLEALRK